MGRLNPPWTPGPCLPALDRPSQHPSWSGSHPLTPPSLEPGSSSTLLSVGTTSHGCLSKLLKIKRDAQICSSAPQALFTGPRSLIWPVAVTLDRTQGTCYPHREFSSRSDGLTQGDSACRGHWAKSGDICGCHNWGVLLAQNEWGPPGVPRMAYPQGMTWPLCPQC